MSFMEVHSSDGATPPEVFSRWIKVVIVSVSPPVGPTWTPAIGSRSQAMASGATNLASEEGIAVPPQTMLESFESCQVARILPNSDGLGGTGLALGLKKWVMICLSRSSNSVASGVKSTNLKPLSEGRQ